MKTLAPLAGEGKGLVGVLLPDTTTSARYVEFDAPYLKQAFEAAGLKPSQFKIDNAQGSASTMQQQAEADITAGASVLLVDPLDPGSGAAIESNAESQGVKVIDYDRLVTGGPADRYYVSFNNVQVGQLIGKGEVSCIAAWHVKKPNILIMDGDPTDNNAKLFAQGYNGVLAPHFADKSYVKVGEPTGTWDPPTAQTTFEQQLTAHSNINAVITPNDDNANAVIAVLQKDKIPPKTFPTTGQDASPSGLQNILKGYQCGTVYKPIYLEAQAAAALAMYLRAGQTPPSQPRQRPDKGHHTRQEHRLRVHHPHLGHHPKHGRHRRQGRRRQGLRPLHRRSQERLHSGRHQLATRASLGGRTCSVRAARAPTPAPRGRPESSLRPPPRGYTCAPAGL